MAEQKVQPITKPGANMPAVDAGRTMRHALATVVMLQHAAHTRMTVMIPGAWRARVAATGTLDQSDRRRAGQ